MAEVIATNLVSIIFGTLSLITSIIAIYYARKSHQLRLALPSEEGGRAIKVFWSREGMIRYLLSQYDAVGSGEEIWAQTVGLTNYPGSVEEKVLKAASRGASFRYIVGETNSDKNSFVALFSSIQSAQIAESKLNRLRVQGLASREVIIAIPTITTYTAVRVTDPEFVTAIKFWFESRWEEATATGAPKVP